MSRRSALLVLILMITWSGMRALYGQTPSPRVGCQVNSVKISTGQSANFTLFVDQLPPLTAYTLTLTYNSQAVQFQDQSQTRDGINLMPSNAFPADAVTTNLVDPVVGKIELAVSAPTSSQLDGKFAVLATGTILGVSQTVSLFKFSETTLFNADKQMIVRSTYGVEECFVEIGNSGTPTPEPTATYVLSALLTATPTLPGYTSVAPTVTPTSTTAPVSFLPTPQSTPTPFFTPFPAPFETDTPEPTPTETETVAPIDMAISNPDAESPLETPDLTQQTPTEESPTPTHTDTETPVLTPSDTPTVESPAPETPTPLPAATDTPTSTPDVPTATPIVRPTPTLIAQVDRELSQAIGVVDQPESPIQVRNEQPYRLLAVATLFGSLALLMAFWQLRRRGRD